jgi:hypothetical protein
MARGWGRSEEDLGSDKELDREAAGAASARLSPEEAARRSRRRQLELSLARLAEQLGVTTLPQRRQALEVARTELRRELARLDGEDGEVDVS